jgi:hypothetical protein
MLDRLYRFFSSLRLTVALLALALGLVFWGTLVQVHLGLYKAQNEFFRSFFIFWEAGNGVRLPIFPGGYLVGGLLVLNLLAAHLRYYQPGRRKWGIVLIHLGVLLMLLGQLLTDALSVESTLHLRHGDTKNYSEASRSYELAITDITDASHDQTFVIPAHRLQRRGEFRHPEMPFEVKVHTFYENSSLVESSATGYAEIQTTAGFGAGLWWRPLPHETQMERRDMPSAIVELVAPQGSLGTFLVSAFFVRPQRFVLGDRQFTLELRLERFYTPHSLHLIEFRHDKYPGTEIPKNFSSRVRVQRPDTGEDREVLIYMNNPLRYAGATYYQASFDTDNQGTVLQVVRNPGWLTPYFSCVLVGVGLLWQFFAHLAGFLRKRKSA